MFDLTWYNSLNHPFLTPPAWIFPPVWTIIYFIMLTALLIYGIKPYCGNKAWGYFLFFGGLIINLCWTPVFFYLKNPGLALCVILFLDFIVVWNIIEFYKISKSSARTLIPYLIWILFATYLNAGIFLLN